MLRILLFALIMISFSCTNETQTGDTTKKDSVVVKSVTETISLIRDTINKKPVVTFSKKVPDELNDWKFAVNVYETKQRFRYLMKIQYEELRAEDTLKIPNLGIEPTIQIKPGSEPFSCIVGFLDKENQFKEYKLVSIKDNSLSIHILQRYGVVASESK